MSTNLFEDVVNERFHRRSLLGGLLKAIPASALLGSQAVAAGTGGDAGGREAKRDTRIQFTAIPGNALDQVTVASGYKSSVLIKWGDPLFNDSPAFDPEAQTAAAQAKQFGYNNDWMDFFPLPAFEVKNPGHGLLAVNHEYTNPELMFRNYVGFAGQSAEQTAIEIEAHGLTVVEVMRSSAGDWAYVPGSRYNRRITGTTMFEMTGPAAGSDWLKTKADPTGRRVIGTLNNCSGGKTPWGTILSGEENFFQYFSNGSQVTDARLSAINTRYGLPAQNGVYRWAKHVDRFDLGKEPNPVVGT